MSKPVITIIGGGLAGCEAAYQVAKRGGEAVLYEMKPGRFSPAHKLSTLAELVCSNSLKAEPLETSSGLLKEEMSALGSLVVKVARETRVPAGGTLAVDRSAFSAKVTDEIASIGAKVIREEVEDVPADRPLVIATGPLTSDAFAGGIMKLLGVPEGLCFYDAVAPIVYGDTIDMERAFMASRYGKGTGDYINCPLDEDEYLTFLKELTGADRVEARGFEEIKVFEGCMPIEVLASRGPRTLLFGPMRPVGLTDPRTGRRPYAVVQLRRENVDGTLYNMVGFQTRLSYPEQKRVLRLIPALRGAEFARFGKLHRNTYMDSPLFLTEAQSLKYDPGIFFAGQITGVEGYCESAASGLMAGINALRAAEGKPPVTPPPVTMMGALLRHISSTEVRPFQPMNANFGILPPLGPGTGARVKKEEKRRLLAERALKEIVKWRDEYLETF